MTKKVINQNTKLNQELINTIEPKFIFSDKPINRFNILETGNNTQQINKEELLKNLKDKINSIENCKLKENSNRIILGEGNINSPLMLIGEAPGAEEEKFGVPFRGEVGELLNKMLVAINIKRQNIYSTYTINFRPPDDRKPTSTEIKRYSVFLKDHISILNPKIIVLMGSSAMEAVTGISEKISAERGNWKEVILKNKTFPLMITFNPSYLIRFPENKKHSWEDLKKIRDKIKYLKLKI
ncbi:uracil-DNA glycosylase [Candidatus Pelagibacter sp.]|nr:uracil-DNA glycosylase [Candidatus Pelagibacter sp.]